MNLRLSKKHGLNPTIPICFFCGEEKNEVVLTGAAGDRIAREMGNKDGEMPMTGVCFDKNPCEKCVGFMKMGIIVISVKDGEADDNPVRTGGWWVMREDFFRRMRNGGNAGIIDGILKDRVAFIEDHVCEMLGLKKENKPLDEHTEEKKGAPVCGCGDCGCGKHGEDGR